MSGFSDLPSKGNVTWSEIRMLGGVGTVLVAVVLAWATLNTKLDLVIQQEKNMDNQQIATTTHLQKLDDEYQQEAVDVAQIKQIIADNQASGRLSEKTPTPNNIALAPESLDTTPIAAQSAQTTPAPVTNNTTNNNYSVAPTPASQQASNPTPTPSNPSPVPTPTSTGIIGTVTGILTGIHL